MADIFYKTNTNLDGGVDKTLVLAPREALYVPLEDMKMNSGYEMNLFFTFGRDNNIDPSSSSQYVTSINTSDILNNIYMGFCINDKGIDRSDNAFCGFSYPVGISLGFFNSGGAGTQSYQNFFSINGHQSTNNLRSSQSVLYKDNSVLEDIETSTSAGWNLSSRAWDDIYSNTNSYWYRLKVRVEFRDNNGVRQVRILVDYNRSSSDYTASSDSSMLEETFKSNFYHTSSWRDWADVDGNYEFPKFGIVYLPFPTLRFRIHALTIRGI